MKKKEAIEFIATFLKDNPETEMPVGNFAFELRNKRFGIPAAYLFYDPVSESLHCRAGNTKTFQWSVDIGKLYKDDLLLLVDKCNQ